MKDICFIGLALLACLYVAMIVNGAIGGLTIGCMGYPDTWENKKCERLHDILATIGWIVMAALLIFVVMFAIAKH